MGHCSKIAVLELLEVFGANERWNCDVDEIASGRTGVWRQLARDDNNLLVQGLSTSRVTWMACFAPMKPVMTGTNTYRCE